MRIRRRRQSKEITAVHCLTCQAVRDVERLEPYLENARFILTCGHSFVLTPGIVCKLDVQADVVVLYPNQIDLPTGRGGV